MVRTWGPLLLLTCYLEPPDNCFWKYFRTKTYVHSFIVTFTSSDENGKNNQKAEIVATPLPLFKG